MDPQNEYFLSNILPSASEAEQHEKKEKPNGVMPKNELLTGEESISIENPNIVHSMKDVMGNSTLTAGQGSQNGMSPVLSTPQSDRNGIEILEEPEDELSMNSENDPNSVKTASISDSASEVRRHELVEKHKALLERRHKAGHLNIQLQTTLSEHFRRKRVDVGDGTHSNVDSMASSIIDTGIDYTARYAKHMETLAEVRDRFMDQKERLEVEINSLKGLSDYKYSEVLKKQEEITEFILSQARKTVSARTGRPLPPEHYKNVIETWHKKTDAVVAERLENLKLQRQMEKINAAFKSYDLSESLHLIDFEQMKIENQTYNEKIEERNEETNKLRRKITNTVQMITHANEKLQSCNAENSQLREQLNLWIEKLTNGRDTLSKLKQSRETLRNTHAAIMRACGLLGQPEMLRGYEDSVDELKSKRQDILNLRQQTQKFYTKTRGLKDKISYIRGDFAH